MPRKSPRSRRRVPPKPHLPKAKRARPAPGRKRTAKTREGPRPHALKGARAARTPAKGKPAARRAAPRFHAPEPERVQALLVQLEGLYPEATTALDFGTPLQLLIATILSAQCTDERVNRVTPGLFARFPDAASLASADRNELEGLIQSTGFFRNKAKAILACCADIVNLHGGEVPRTLDALVALHGVGRKTANVVLGNAFGIPGLVVDTHVGRLARRLGLTDEEDPVKVEFALMDVVPKEKWTRFSHWLILHGRRVCIARKPRCSICPLAPHCPRLGVTTSA